MVIVFSKFKIFKRVDLLRMTIKVKLESSCSRATFVFGVVRGSARNQEYRRDEDGLSFDEQCSVPPCLPACSGVCRRPFPPPPRAGTRSCLRVQAEQELARLEDSPAPLKARAGRHLLLSHLSSVAGEFGPLAKFVAAAASPPNRSRL